MSVSVEADVSSPLSDGQDTTLDPSISKSSSDSHSLKNEEVEEKSEPGTPKPHPMAFTIDFGNSKQVDNRRLEELAKKSQARHQRVQSMSASLTRPSPTLQRPPMSAKLPRKAQGYNSEGYFSSDQEENGLSSAKLRSSPLAQTAANITSPITNRHIKSPISDTVLPKRTSKSPIVDSIMSRSDNFSNRQGLNLPLKSNNYMRDIHRTPSYGNINRHAMGDITDQSPDAIMLTDISSPELDILTPDNGLSTPEHSKSPLIRKIRASSETPDLFKKCIMKEPLYIDDDVDRQSDNSSTGTYTIEGDNYTEEQKARMSIDRTFGTDLLTSAIEDTLRKQRMEETPRERDPELVFDFPNPQRVITKEPRRDTGLRSALTSQPFDLPKVSKDKNVLEISCCYESPTENDLAAQTSKQIKSTRSYLEKIKNRVRNITEKTFALSPPKYEDADVGSFTSVTTSGVLSSKSKAPPKKIPEPVKRRGSLTQSEIDQTDYIHRFARESDQNDFMHRLSRESSVPVSLPSNNLEGAKFESTALRNAQRALREDSVPSDLTPEQMVGKLSYLSLNRCKGDKTWIQDWAESVKKYNAMDVVDGEKPPLSPRQLPIKPRSPLNGTPTKIPSPVGTLMHRRTPINNMTARKRAMNIIDKALHCSDITFPTPRVINFGIPEPAQDLIPAQETEAYLLKTQNAITNLQAKLQTSRTTNYNNIPSQLTSSLISEKTAVSRLPISQLSRSNSLNYRLRRKEHSNDSSPLRSPGHYVITGSSKLPETTKILLNTASRSLDTDRKHDPNMNSPNSDRGLLSHSSDDKTLSNRPAYDGETISSPHRKTHSRNRSFDARNKNIDVSNANQAVCLKTVLKHNALDTKLKLDQSRCLGDKKHQRVSSDGLKYKPNNVGFGSSIKRSSSFNTVNKNNNYIDLRITSRRSSGHSEEYKDYSDDSDNGMYNKSQDYRYKKQIINRGRIDSPDLKSIAPANSPRCPNTPEMQRKFGPGLVRNSVRVTNKERMMSPRVSEQAVVREERKPANHQSRRSAEPRQTTINRLTKSRSSTREVQPIKNLDLKGQKKPSQHRSSSALASKEVEFSNWKKRSSYDPMKAAQEGRRRQQMAKRQDNKDDLSSPSHSSPVHRSQSFHTTNIADLEVLDYSSEETEDEQTLPVDPMITSTHSDILDLRRKDYGNLRRKAMNNDVVLAREYVTNFQVNQPDKKRRDSDKRKTFIIDDITPTKENIDFLTKTREKEESAIDKRKTFILDSDTNSTTNGSSPRNSSIFSQEKNSLTTGTSDTEGESGTESAPVVMRHAGGKRTTPAQAKQRYSGDFSMSSSTTSINKKPVQPRYLDISKYKNEQSPKHFLRRDPSKTYVGVLNNNEKSKEVSKGSAQHYEMEQKKQELEKWKRRASYDPRKAAALGKTNKTPSKTASSVLRSQSFHGPVLGSPGLRPAPDQICEYDASSDNDF